MTTSRQSKKPGMKFAKGKLMYHIIPWESLEQLAAAFTVGAFKYEKENWKKLTEEGDVASIMRHVEAHRRGELIDPDTGVAHMGAVMAQAAFCVWRNRDKLNHKWDFEGIGKKYAKDRKKARR